VRESTAPTLHFMPQTPGVRRRSDGSLVTNTDDSGEVVAGDYPRLNRRPASQPSKDRGESPGRAPSHCWRGELGLAVERGEGWTTLALASKRFNSVVQPKAARCVIHHTHGCRSGVLRGLRCGMKERRPPRRPSPFSPGNLAQIHRRRSDIRPGVGEFQCGGPTKAARCGDSTRRLAFRQ
jgi:hypothetical protein